MFEAEPADLSAVPEGKSLIKCYFKGNMLSFIFRLSEDNTLNKMQQNSVK